MEEELPPYSEHDLTFVTPLSNRELSNNQNRELNQYQNRDQSQYQNSYSTEALEISHTPVQDQSRKVLSDSQVNMISVHTPISCHENLVAKQRHAHQDPAAQQSSVRRSELCTPIRSSSLSASDSQLHKLVKVLFQSFYGTFSFIVLSFYNTKMSKISYYCIPIFKQVAIFRISLFYFLPFYVAYLKKRITPRKKITDDKESYERAQSVPYGMEKNGVSSTVENILAKKFTNQVRESW